MTSAKLSLSLFLLLWLIPTAKADVTILLEEPYSYDGAFAGTGHAAIYLTRICAASPTLLRRCQPEEVGTVISRYHRIAGRDWIAVPLYPYLYAVDRPEQVPLFVNTKLEAALRDRYRRAYLQDLVPDGYDGATPGGDWYELVGSAYDRTLYGFQLETTPEQDDQFIAHYNAQPNRESYKLVTRNCADFVRDAVNFYYPKAVKRGLIADWDISTPKHAAKSLTQYSKKHPELQFITFVIPQVPGTIRRSKPVRGLVESVFKAKKYELPLLALYPAAAGGFAAAYVAKGRFNPAHDAMIYGPDGSLELPLSSGERRAYSKGLEEVTRAGINAKPRREETSWQQFLSKARLQPDNVGRPALQLRSVDSVIEVGITRENILNGSAPPQLIQELVLARLREELRGGGAPRISAEQLRRDWKLLKTVFADKAESIEARANYEEHAPSGRD